MLSSFIERCLVLECYPQGHEISYYNLNMAPLNVELNLRHRLELVSTNLLFWS